MSFGQLFITKHRCVRFFLLIFCFFLFYLLFFFFFFLYFIISIIIFFFFSFSSCFFFFFFFYCTPQLPMPQSTVLGAHPLLFNPGAHTELPLTCSHCGI